MICKINESSAIYSELYGKYYKDMYRLALHLMKNPCDAQDAVHDAFLKLMSNPKVTLGDECKAKALLIITVRSVCLDDLKKIRHDISYEELDKEPACYCRELEQAAAPDPAELISALPDKLKRTMTLRYIKGFDVGETAKILGVKPSCVHSRIRLSRRLLKQMIG